MDVSQSRGSELLRLWVYIHKKERTMSNLGGDIILETPRFVHLKSSLSSAFLFFPVFRFGKDRSRWTRTEDERRKRTYNLR
jgi:hypothetical protein